MFFSIISSVRLGIIVNEETESKRKGTLNKTLQLQLIGSFLGTERLQLIPSEGLFLFILAALTFSANISHALQ